MATTVTAAFRQFREGLVDLDPGETTTARASRDNLMDQITSLSRGDTDFPQATGNYFFYGSFARKTKIRPLNDIDLMMLLAGRGLREVRLHTYSLFGTSAPDAYRLAVDDRAAPLAPFADASGCVNSISVLNRVRSSLASVHHYRKAEINRRQQAVVLNLVSYPWSFDVVPAFGVSGDTGATTHYLIPDGAGNWMKTDPRVDARLITQANQAHAGRLLPIIRLLKYWNWHLTYQKPRLPSFYFEFLVYRVFHEAAPAPIVDDRVALLTFFQSCPPILQWGTASLTDFGPRVDAQVSWEEKNKVSRAMADAAANAEAALRFERTGDQRQALAGWGRIFGAGFPSYG